ncbi:MAG: hypothetical protein Kow0065_07220 [Methylomicrobium sp.]
MISASDGLRKRTFYSIVWAFVAALLINLALLLLIGSLISRRQSEWVASPSPRPIDFIRIVRKVEPEKPVEPTTQRVEDRVEPQAPEKPPEAKPAKAPAKNPPKKVVRPIVRRSAKPVAKPAPKIDIPEQGQGAVLPAISGTDSPLTAPPLGSGTPSQDTSPDDRGEADVNGGGVSARQLVVVSRVLPNYPRRARDRGIEGWVKLEVVVSPRGDVSSAKVLSAEPKGVFERAALEAIRRWRFKPAYQNGRAVEQRAAQVISFRLDKRRR